MAINYPVNIILRLDGNLSGLQGAAGNARGAAGAFNETGNAGRNAGRGMDDAERSSRSLKSSLGSLKTLLGGLGLISVAREFWEANRAMASWLGGLQTGTGSIAAAAREMEFLNRTGDALGLRVADLAPNLVSMTAAAQGTALAGGQLRDVFSGLVEYGTALRVGNERIKLSLQAVQQMISKGVVSAEELRQQLGESMPGAMRIAAEAMGMTTAEFNKQVAAGNILAVDLLPKMAARMRDLAAAGLEVAATSPEAELNRAANAWSDLLVAMGDAGVNDALAQMFRDLTSSLRDFVSSGTAQAVGEGISWIVSNLGTLVDILAVLAVAKGLAWLIAGFTALGVAAKAALLQVMLSTAAAAEFTVAATAASTSVGLWGASLVVLRTALLALLPGLGLIAAAWGVITLATADWSSASERAEATLARTGASQRSGIELLKEWATGSRETASAMQDFMTRLEADIKGRTRELTTLGGSIDNTKQSLADLQGVKFMPGFAAEAARLNDVLERQQARYQQLIRYNAVLRTVLDQVTAAWERMAAAEAERQKNVASADEHIKDLEKEAQGLRVRQIELTKGTAAAMAYVSALKLTADASDDQRAKDAALRAEIVMLKGSIDATTKAISERAAETRKAKQEDERAAKELAKLRAEMPLEDMARRNQLLEDEAELIKKRSDAVAESARQVDEYLLGIREETVLLGLTGEARERQARLFEAERVYRAVLLELTRAQIPAEEALNRALQARSDTLDALATRDDVQRISNFNFTEQLSNAISEAFRTGSLSAGFRKFFADFKTALSGGVSSAMGAINQALQFAAPVIDAYRNSNGNAAGSALRAVNQQLAQSGNIFAQIASAVDSIFGGRLFGTDWETQRRGVDIATGPAGSSGSQYTDQTRQRSFFRGTARQRLTDDLDQSVQSQLDGFFQSMLAAITAGVRRLRTVIPDLITGTFSEVVDADGKVVSRASTVRGVTYNEDLQSHQMRLLGENLLEVINTLFRVPAGANIGPGPGNGAEAGGGGSSGGSGLEPDPRFSFIKAVEAYTGEASAIAQRWRSDAATLLDGAQFLLLAAEDIRNGVGLLLSEGGLTAIADLIEDLAQPGESLQQTYARVVGATNVLDQATQLLGITLDGNREAFVRFATDIAEAAGGVEHAQNLWNRYFETFYSAEERAQSALQQAQSSRASALAAIGLEATTTAEQFREQFEAALPRLSPSEIVLWLQAGAAIGAVISAEEQLTAAREEATEAAREAAEQQAEALRTLSELQQSHIDQLAELGRTDLGNTIAGIGRWREEQISALNEAAQAAGFHAASEEDLTRVHQIAAIRISRAIAQIEAAGRSSAERLRELMGGGANRSATNSADMQGVGAVQDAVEDRYARELQLLQQLSDFLNDMIFAPYSIASPAEQLAAAQAQYQQTLAAAQGGDLDALANLRDVSAQYLQQARSYHGVSVDFDEIFRQVQSTLGALVTAGPRNTPVVSSAGGGGYSDASSASSTLQSDAEAQRAERLALVQEISGMIREVMQVTGESAEVVAARMGTSLDELARGMGINLDRVTAATVTQLAGLAQMLGVELSEVAAGVGVSLGNLADKQSLLNQGLALQISKLPDADRARLEPLFQNITRATTEADANAAIAALEGEVNLLPAGIRDLLAPYLTGVSPAETSQVNLLSDIRTEGRLQTEIQAQMLAVLRGQQTVNGVTTMTATVVPVGTTPPPPTVAPVIVVPPKSASEDAEAAAAAQHAAALERRQADLEAQLRRNDDTLRELKSTLGRLLQQLQESSRTDRELAHALAKL